MLLGWLASLLAALFAGAGSAVHETVLDCVQPDLATSDGAVLVTCGRDRTILWTRSQDGGVTFEALREVAKVPGLALGMRRGPRIAAAGRTVLIAAIVQTDPRNSGDVIVWRSSDGGQRWTASPPLNTERSSAREGLHALAAAGEAVVAAWLDIRETGTTLRARVSRDAGASWEDDRLLYRSPSGAICECCHPSLVVNPDGTFTAMFRNERDGHRDMFVVDSEGAASRIGSGTWRLDACPMDGGDLTRDADANWVSVWRREETIYLAAAGSRERPNAAGRDPVLAVNAAGVHVAWSAPQGVMLLPPGAQARLLDRRGRFPVLAAIDDTANRPSGVVAAWQRGTVTVVRP